MGKINFGPPFVLHQFWLAGRGFSWPVRRILLRCGDGQSKSICATDSLSAERNPILSPFPFEPVLWRPHKNGFMHLFTFIIWLNATSNLDRKLFLYDRPLFHIHMRVYSECLLHLALFATWLLEACWIWLEASSEKKFLKTIFSTLKNLSIFSVAKKIRAMSVSVFQDSIFKTSVGESMLELSGMVELGKNPV